VTSDDGTIDVCAPGLEDSTDGTIDICAPGPEPTDGAIDICDKCGAGTPDLTVSEAGEGSYSASGGKPPYRWAVSCGSIDASGEIVDISDCCGTGTVTVTDSCGTSASTAIRFPIGQWVQTGCIPGPCSTNCDPIAGTTTCGKMVSICEKISGAGKIRYEWYSYNAAGCVGGWGCGCSSDNAMATNPCSGAAFAPMKCSCGNGCGNFETMWRTVYYQWKCP
jgi:hypothetical protein